AVLTAVLAVHTAAPPPAEADRQAAAFANPAPAVMTVRSPLPLLDADSVGASAVGGSMTALVGGLLDAARPPAPDAVAPADGSGTGGTASAPAASGVETRSRAALAALADLAEAVLGPLHPSSATGPDRSQARGLAD